MQLDEWLAENRRKQAERQAEPGMKEAWDPSDPAGPFDIGVGWDTKSCGLGL